MTRPPRTLVLPPRLTASARTLRAAALRRPLRIVEATASAAPEGLGGPGRALRHSGTQPVGHSGAQRQDALIWAAAWCAPTRFASPQSRPRSMSWTAKTSPLTG